MPAGLQTLVDRLRGAVRRDALASAADAELLQRFADRRDEVAFAELVHRHAPAVYALCRRHLTRPADLDDAFQATFVVLAQKAGTVMKPDKLSAWLCGVADRVARKARSRSAKRAGKERPLGGIEPAAATPDPETDLRAVLDDELRQLPAEYRAAVLLCDVDGVSRREAARRLSVPDGTLSNRLARARAMLGRRLLRRGVALGAGLSLSSVASAAVPARLVALAVSRGASVAVPPELLTLAAEVPMLPIRSALAVLLVGVAVGVAAFAQVGKPPVKAAPPEATKVAEVDPEPEEITGWAPAAAYSRDGKLLALTLSATNEVKVYDTATWQVVHTLEGLKNLSHAVVFSADGKALYAAGYDGPVYVWDAKTGKAGPTLDPKTGPCTGLVLSPDGKTLASGHHDPEGKTTAIHLWDTKTGKPVRSISGDDPLLPNCLAFSPDGKAIAGGYHATHSDPKNVGGFHGVIEWDTATGKEANRFEIPRITPGATPITHCLAYTKDGKRLIVAGGEADPIPGGGGCMCIGYLWVFDRKTNAVEKTLIGHRPTDYVRLIALSADGKKLLVPTHTPPRRVVRNGQVQMQSFSSLQCWDTETWELDWAHEKEAGTVTAVTVSPDGKRVAVSDTSGCFLLDARTGDEKGGLVRAKGR
jgi:RNA polymerase sigma factor (sigma-70 family)